MTNLNLLFAGNDLLPLSLKMKDKSLISRYGNPVYVNFKEVLLIGSPFDGLEKVMLIIFLFETRIKIPSTFCFFL